MENLTCPKCSNPFDELNHKPRMFSNCGHTFCTKCILSMVTKINCEILKCPDEEERCPGFKVSRGIDSFPVNKLVLNFVQKSNKIKSSKTVKIEDEKPICPEHNKIMDIVCLTDSIPICSNCALFGTHQSHKFLTNLDFQKQTEQAIQMTENMLALTMNKRFTQDHLKDISQVRDTISNKFNALACEIQDSFTKLTDAINKQKQSCLDKLEFVFLGIEKIAESIAIKSGQLNERADRLSFELNEFKKMNKNMEYHNQAFLNQSCPKLSLKIKAQEIEESVNRINDEFESQIDKRITHIEIFINESTRGMVIQEYCKIKDEIRMESSEEPVNTNEDHSEMVNFDFTSPGKIQTGSSNKDNGIITQKRLTGLILDQSIIRPEGSLRNSFNQNKDKSLLNKTSKANFDRRQKSFLVSKGNEKQSNYENVLGKFEDKSLQSKTSQSSSTSRDLLGDSNKLKIIDLAKNRSSIKTNPSAKVLTENSKSIIQGNRKTSLLPKSRRDPEIANDDKTRETSKTKFKITEFESKLNDNKPFRNFSPNFRPNDPAQTLKHSPFELRTLKSKSFIIDSDEFEQQIMLENLTSTKNNIVITAIKPTTSIQVITPGLTNKMPLLVKSNQKQKAQENFSQSKLTSSINISRHHEPEPNIEVNNFFNKLVAEKTPNIPIRERSRLYSTKKTPIPSLIDETEKLYQTPFDLNLNRPKGNEKKLSLSNEANVLEMNFSEHKINDANLLTIIPMIAKNKKVKIVDLSHNYITDTGVETILKKLGGHPTLESLILNGNYVEEKVFDVIKNHAKMLKKISYLNLKDNRTLKDRTKMKIAVSELKKLNIRVDV